MLGIVVLRNEPYRVMPSALLATRSKPISVNVTNVR